MNKKLFISIVLFSLFIIIFSGCTKSLPMHYHEGLDIENIDVENEKSIGITKFKDNRSITKSGSEDDQSFVATQAPWQFGLTYEDEKYCPVNKIVNRILFKEMKAAGFNVETIDLIPPDQEVKTLVNLAKNESVDYVLGGEILGFEFINDVGVWTVASRQSVTLSLTLVSVQGDVVFNNSTFNDSHSENEGMVVRHSTNVDKLLNIVFKDVLEKVLVRIATELAINVENISITIAVGSTSSEAFKFIDGTFQRT